MRSWYLFVLLLLATARPAAAGEWLCEEAASVRDGSAITVCGIGEDADEDKARKMALKNAFSELDLVCGRSADCKDFELNIDPMRNECKRSGANFKCYRAVHVEITDRRQPSATPGAAAPVEAAVDKREVILQSREQSQVARVTTYKCDYETEAALNMFQDLTSPAKLAVAVKTATAIPMRLACAKFHFDVMNLLERAGLVSATYNDFLLRTVHSTLTADDLDIAIVIIKFFHVVGPYEKSVWKTARDLFARLTDREMYALSPYLFHTSVPAAERELQTARLDELMKEARAQHVGRPIALSYDGVFAEVARGLVASPNGGQPWLAQALFSRYFGQVERVNPEAMISVLQTLYKNSNSAAERKQVLGWMKETFAKAPPEWITANAVTRFVDQLNRERKSLDPETESGSVKLGEIRTTTAQYVEQNSKTIDLVFARLKDKTQIQNAIDFCLENSVHCPSIVPGPPELKKMLKSEFKDKKILALKIINRQTEVSRALEGDVYALLLDVVENGSAYEIETLAIQSLINHRLDDIVKIRKIFKLSLERRFNYEEVIKSLGPLATPVVIEIALDDAHPNQFTGVTMLRLLAKKDPKALETLKAIAATHANTSLRQSAKTALESLGQ